jgi:hypothetical protein
MTTKTDIECARDWVKNDPETCLDEIQAMGLDASALHNVQLMYVQYAGTQYKPCTVDAMKVVLADLAKTPEAHVNAAFNAVALAARAKYDAALVEADRVCKETKEKAWVRYQSTLDTVRPHK